MTAVNAVGNSLTGLTGTGKFVGDTSPTLVTPVLGTPTSGTLTNCTLPVGGITGLGSGVATWLATPTSANLATAVATTSTGSGSLTFATSPTIVTPVIAQINDANGNTMMTFTATASSVNYLGIGNAATGGAVGISPAGSDTNIALEILSKGSGLMVFASTSVTPIEILSGTSYQHGTFFTMANTAVGRTVTFPDSSGTLVLASNAANGSVATVLGSVGPVGSHTTVQTWLSFVDPAGTTRYVPCF